ncbi:tyrosine-type recombinase/integrase [Aureimonas altamirensis]|uniref:tyrosine-type recombinase/integrase n=1 Tax=Aureimonas altamirensis TaxID=370622 RepID=UPI00255445A4|nr:integrase arm-type DNA-binding domain-containing protein [Aureimonas altamirensis]
MLTDAQVRKVKPADRPQKLADGGGLMLFVSPSGGKLWRFRYRFNAKQKELSLGIYPTVGLADAREARDRAKKILQEGRDPSIAKKIERAIVRDSSANTFETVAREWHELNKSSWTARHEWDVLNSLERDVFPELGNVPIRDLGPPQVLSLLRVIEGRDAKETARRIRQRMSAVFVYAIASGRADTDPAAIVRGAMAPMTKGRQPAIINLVGAREIIAKVDAQHAHPGTKLALRLLALTALRPGTLIETPWMELPQGVEVWTIPASRMKMRKAHKDDAARDFSLPLSEQAKDTIEALRGLSGKGPLVFPNTRHAHKPMSENAIGYLLNRSIGLHRHVPHGWRASFSSIMNERFPQDRAIIDLMLAHSPENKTEGAYNRAAHMQRRKELAQEWANLLLDGQMPIADLLTLPRR